MSGAVSDRKKVTVVTTSRADFSIYQSVLNELSLAENIDLGLLVSGMHLLPEFGNTIQEVEDSRFSIRDKFEGLLASDTEAEISRSMGLTTVAAAESFAKNHTDLLVVLGDRFEMHAIALAALPFRIPIAHIHGGEETEGAIDNSLRHSITKLSHLHFCATELAAKRIRAMGEDPSKICVSGAPALDNFARVPLLDRVGLEQKFDIPKDEKFVLVTFHPETLDPNGSLIVFEYLLKALEAQDLKAVFTLANADTLGRTLNEKIRTFVANQPDRAMLVEHMGAQGYYSAMRAASLMIGNSSSGIIEAASFGLPVVNIGERQRGRERSQNVIDVAGTQEAINDGMSKALSEQHAKTCESCKNIYGDGHAGERIRSAIQDFMDTDMSVSKRFFLENQA